MFATYESVATLSFEHPLNVLFGNAAVFVSTEVKLLQFSKTAVPMS